MNKMKKIIGTIWCFLILLVALPFVVVGAVVATVLGTAMRGLVFGYLYVDGAIVELTNAAGKVMRGKK